MIRRVMNLISFVPREQLFEMAEGRIWGRPVADDIQPFSEISMVLVLY